MKGRLIEMGLLVLEKFRVVEGEVTKAEIGMSICINQKLDTEKEMSYLTQVFRKLSLFIEEIKEKDKEDLAKKYSYITHELAREKYFVEEVLEDTFNYYSKILLKKVYKTLPLYVDSGEPFENIYLVKKEGSGYGDHLTIYGWKFDVSVKKVDVLFVEPNKIEGFLESKGIKAAKEVIESKKIHFNLDLLEGGEKEVFELLKKLVEERD
jgi:hypothetical protein